MKNTLILLTSLFCLCSCTTGYINKTQGVVAFNVIGGDSSKFMASEQGFYVEGMNHSKSFKTAAVAAVAWETVGQIASTIKNADTIAGSTAKAKSAAGVSNAKTAAGVSKNASDNALKALQAKESTKVLLKP